VAFAAGLNSRCTLVLVCLLTASCIWYIAAVTLYSFINKGYFCKPTCLLVLVNVLPTVFDTGVRNALAASLIPRYGTAVATVAVFSLRISLQGNFLSQYISDTIATNTERSKNLWQFYLIHFVEVIGQYEDGCLLGCRAVETGASLPAFQKSLLPPSSGRFWCWRQYRPLNRPDDGGSTDLWNVGKLIPVYTALQPRRQPSSYSPPWEPHVVLNWTAVIYFFKSVSGYLLHRQSSHYIIKFLS
jgi:hypothetical protein